MIGKCKQCDKEYKLIRIKQRKYPHLCKSCASMQVKSLPRTYGERCNGSRSKLYRTWTGIRGRVFTKTDKDYKDGIKMHDAWDDFFVFKEYMLSIGFNEESQIRRINPNGNYEPDNIKLVHRPIKRYMFEGKKRLASEIYDMVSPLPVSKKLFRRRLARGWSINKAMMEPKRANQYRYA